MTFANKPGVSSQTIEGRPGKGTTLMNKTVYQRPDGLWGWAVISSSTVLHYAEGLESYPDADDAADEAMRWVLKEASALARERQKALIDDALHALSEPARQVITKKRILADTATVSEIAAAFHGGLFEYEVRKNSSEMMAKEDVAEFLRARNYRVS